jgi:hypothetical protein
MDGKKEMKTVHQMDKALVLRVVLQLVVQSVSLLGFPCKIPLLNRE